MNIALYIFMEIYYLEDPLKIGYNYISCKLNATIIFYLDLESMASHMYNMCDLE